MRIKAVLRDGDILKMEVGAKERIIAAAKKNIDRFVSLTSLLKVMGLDFEDRIRMLESLADVDIHIWFSIESQQHIVYLSKKGLPHDVEGGYQWQ